MIWIKPIIPIYRVSNAELYGDLPRVSFKVRQKLLRLGGYASRNPELPLCKVILWKPVHGYRCRGRLRATYVDNLLRDTGVETAGELESSWILWQLLLTKPKLSKSYQYLNKALTLIEHLI